jgi:parallel beta-helix repeat protein
MKKIAILLVLVILFAPFSAIGEYAWSGADNVTDSDSNVTAPDKLSNTTMPADDPADNGTGNSTGEDANADDQQALDNATSNETSANGAITNETIADETIEDETTANETIEEETTANTTGNETLPANISAPIAIELLGGPLGDGSPIYVPDNYTTIQAAVNASSPGDTIIVSDGTYTENVMVNKALTIQSENGSANCIVQTANPSNYVFVVTASNVTIRGFTLKNANGTGAAGIRLQSGVGHCTISNNTASNNYCGIYLYTSSNNNLTGNTVVNNSYGIRLYASSNNNTVTANTASNNSNSGIYLYSSLYNNLTNNTASYNSAYGIHLYSSSKSNTLTNNTASNNGKGIYLSISCNNNTLTGNTVSYNTQQGIYLDSSNNNNTLTGNTASYNYRGISLASSSYNNLTGNTANSNTYIGIELTSSNSNILTSNTVSNNSDYRGIYLYSSSYNTIYNNYFNNTKNAYDNGANTWNITKTSSANIIGGDWLGGNYWSDYLGIDSDGDGQGDTPYSITGGINKDYLPLVEPRVHNLNTGENFSTIHAAIDAENTTYGHIIQVDSGPYMENVIVHKSLTIQSAKGSGSTIVQAANSSEHVFNVTADYVTISGFTVTNATGSGQAGIYLGSGVQHCTISNNTVSNNTYGIYLDSSSTNNLTANTASNNSEADFLADEYSASNTITDLTVSSYSTTISFTFDHGIAIKGVDTAPADPDGWQNISKYVNITNVTTNSWIDLQVSYNDTDLGKMDDSTLRLWKHNGTDWLNVSGSMVNTTANYVAANISSFSIFAPLGEEPKLVHNLRTNESFSTIQNAIYDPDTQPGDIITVDPGTYMENVVVNKALTLRSENGSASTIVQAADVNKHVFTVTANYVNISVFTVTGATGYNKVGIYLGSEGQHCTISNNTVSNNYYGIYLDSSSNNNTLAGNTESYNNYGIYLDSSSNNSLTGNIALDSTWNGLYLYDSNNNNLTGNNVSNNGDIGIYLQVSSNNSLTGNTVSDNGAYGVYLDYASNNNLTNNTANADYNGIYLQASSNNILSGNTANSNLEYGIGLDYSCNNNTLTDNIATSNYAYGIYLYSSNSNNLTGNSASSNGVAGAIRADTGTYKVVYFSFGFEAINNSAMRDTVMSRTVTWLDSNLSGSVLLVDDDQGADYESYYNDSLINNSIGYDYWDTSSQGSPNNSTLSSYPVVIWFTGDDYSDTLNTSEQSALEQYLNDGGNLFLTGQYIGYDLNDDGVFYSTYLHAIYVTEEPTAGLAGVSGDPISDGLTIGISDGDGADNQFYPDRILPRENATTVLYYTGTEGVGIFLDSSDSNNLTANTVSKNTEADFYSTDGSENNSIANLNVSSYPTTISFTYDNGIEIKGVDTAPADPEGKQNISRYVNITNVTASSWIDLQVRYNDTELGGVDESTLQLWRHNGSVWTLVSDSSVNTDQNYVYANISSFSIFAPFANVSGGGGDELTCSCGDICVNQTGWWRDGGTFNENLTSPIQAAVDNATEGEIICVQDGTYTENVDVYKSLTVRSANGSASTIVQAANTSEHVFNVTADYVNITGFTVTGATGSYPNYPAGIYLLNAQHCSITDTNASNNDYGIEFINSDYNSVKNNTAISNQYNGIALLDNSDFNTITNNTVRYGYYSSIYLYNNSNNNTLINNTVTSNINDNGITIYYSNDNILVNNTATLNDWDGIRLEHACNNTLTGNNASNNGDYGIMLHESCHNSTLTNNTANANGNDGIDISSSHNNTLAGNNASYNGRGIYLWDSNYNILTNNTAISNEDVGIDITGDHNSLTDNTVTANYYGIDLSGNYNILTNNTATANDQGITLGGNYNTLTNSTATLNVDVGIDIAGDYNSLMNNTAASNGYGIRLGSCNSTLTSNTMANNTYNFGVEGCYLTCTIDTTNTVNGKPVQYLVDVKDLVIDASWNVGYLGIVNATNITVKNLTLIGNGQGVLLAHTTDARVKNVTASNNSCGIYITDTTDARVENVTAGNNGYGVYLNGENNTVMNTTATSNTYGIVLAGKNNTVTNTTATSNDYGIYLSSDASTLLNNNFSSNNYYGIYLYYSQHNTLTNNYAFNNSDSGIFLYYYSNNNSLIKNVANSNAYYGIFLSYYSNNNSISGNTVTSNGYDGIRLYYSDSNTIYNNYFINPINAWDNGNNIWNITKTNGTNIVSGSFLGGNYWSDYAGTDNDTPPDGLGDTLLPYNSTGFIQKGGDWHPLIAAPPVANFTASPLAGTAPLSVQFTDLSTDSPTSWLWDFGDGNTTNNTLQHPVHTYWNAGIYNVSLNVTNAAGSNTTIKVGYIDVSEGGGGGGGDGGDENETQLNCTCGDLCVNMTGWWYDNDTFHASDTPIQSAVDNAITGEIICVQDGTYEENVDVTTEGITIQSENGSASTIVQAADSYDHVFEVTANNVSISGFTVLNATGASGMYLETSEYSLIINNTILSNDVGISLQNSAHITIDNNTISHNYHELPHSGIHLENVNYSTIANNKILDNDDGVYLLYSSFNIIRGNDASSNDYSGITLEWSDNNSISNSTASNNNYGIYLSYSGNNELMNNTFVNNGLFVSNSYSNTVTDNTVNDKPLVYREAVSGQSITDAGQVILVNCDNITVKNIEVVNASVGMELWGTNNSTIMNITASNNIDTGIYLLYSSNNILTNNTATSNFLNGVYFYSSSNNTLTSSTATSNSDGFILDSSSNYNNLTNNTATSNGLGIELVSSSNNNIKENIATNNTRGIELWNSSNNNITDNTANSNNNCGMYLSSSSDNTIYNNYFNNTNNAYDDATNRWNITSTEGKNIIGGQNLGGNYWNDYSGNDTTGDGLGDTPYDIPGGSNQDQLPLTSPAVIIALNLSTSSIQYGTVAAQGSQTSPLINVTNAGTVNETFLIRGEDAYYELNASYTWILSTSIGEVDHYMHEFYNGSWYPLSTEDIPLAGNVPLGGITTFRLRITLPSDITHPGNYTTTVTIMATEVT